MQDDEANETIASWYKNLEEQQKCKTFQCNERLTEDARNIEL